MDHAIITEWQELGFYYESDSQSGLNQWRFYGSKQGLRKLANLFMSYSKNPDKSPLSADTHYGPYSYFKLTTLAQPIITYQYFGGTLNDFQFLSELIVEKLNRYQPGEIFSLSQAYGTANTATAKCFVMADNFDPASMDESAMSD